MEFQTSMYYTFSTIAQVIAGFIGLGSVFVLFKFQELKKAQLTSVGFFLDYTKDVLIYSATYQCSRVAVKLSILYKSEYIEGMLKEMNLIILDNKVVDNKELKHLLTGVKNNFEKLEYIKSLLKKLTRISIMLGVGTFLYSFILLSNTHFIPKSCSTILMILGILLGMSSIFIMTRVIVLSLYDFKFLSPEKKIRF